MDFTAANRDLTQNDLDGFFKRFEAVLNSSTKKWTGILEMKETNHFPVK